MFRHVRTINPIIYFTNITLNPTYKGRSNFDIRNVRFKRKVHISGFINNVPNLVFENCIFEEGLQISDGKKGDYFPNIRLTNCRIEGSFRAWILNGSNSNLYMSNSQIVIDRTKDIDYFGEMQLDNGEFCLKKANWGEAPSYSTIELGENSSTTLVNVEVASSSDRNWFSITRSSSLHLDSCKFNTNVLLGDLVLQRACSIRACEFKSLSTAGIVLPQPSNVEVDWENLKKSLCLMSIFLVEDTTLAISTHFELKNYNCNSKFDLRNHNILISSYMQWMLVYKELGDIESLNNCYIEMKDVQTEKYKSLYMQFPSFQALFSWKINQFLGFFCDYGTNPVKSIVHSFYVIMFFSFFFFIFGNNENFGRKIVQGYNYLAMYFLFNRKPYKYRSNLNSETFKIWQYTYKKTGNRRNQLPKIIRLLSLSILFFLMLRSRIDNYVINRLYSKKKSWTRHSNTMKVFLNVFIIFIIISYIIYLVVICFANSIILSINAFTTLGFGKIPVKGIGMYVAIIEGLIGWFLLSIFTVSLVSQVLQI